MIKTKITALLIKCSSPDYQRGKCGVGESFSSTHSKLVEIYTLIMEVVEGRVSIGTH